MIRAVAILTEKPYREVYDLMRKRGWKTVTDIEFNNALKSIVG